jgi:hypothetical protein
MILIPMERWRSTFDSFKKHYWMVLGVTRTPVMQYTEGNPEDGVFYIEARECMRLDFEDPQWETWFRLQHSHDMVDTK